MTFEDVIKLYKEGIRPKDLKDMIEVKKEFDALEQENPDAVNSILNNQEGTENGEGVNYRELYENEKAEKERLTLEIDKLNDDLHILNSENETNKSTIAELQNTLSNRDLSGDVPAVDINEIIKNNL